MGGEGREGRLVETNQLAGVGPDRGRMVGWSGPVCGACCGPSVPSCAAAVGQLGSRAAARWITPWC